MKKIIIPILSSILILGMMGLSQDTHGEKPENHCVINEAIGIGVLHCIMQPTVGQHFQFMSVGFVCHADVIRVDSETMDFVVSGGEDNRDIPTCPSWLHNWFFPNRVYTILPQN
jgi:hypothetical protein